jgi:hypothetical protein
MNVFFKGSNRTNDGHDHFTPAKKFPLTVSWTAAAILIFFFVRTTASYSQAFESVERLTPFYASKNSGERTQSKVWRYDGKWWTVFPISTGTYIWRLDGNTWRNVLKIASSSSTKADCKTINNVCHIFLWRKYDYASMLVSVAYDPLTKNYKLWPQRRTTTLVKLQPGVETATIEIDATGRMWLASDGASDIRIRWSDPPYNTWSNPYIIASGVADDDIGTVVSLPAIGKIGVFWGNQNTKRYGFKTHVNGASPTTWSADELPGAGSALNIKAGMADDHIDLAVSSNGSLFAVYKTGYDTYGYPKIGLLKRHPNGTWDKAYKVSDTGTKPIIIINAAINKLKVIFPARSGEDILYRESPLDVISFGSTRTLLSGAYDNPTSAKGNYDQEIVILATDVAKGQIAGVMAADGPATVSTTARLATAENLSTGQQEKVDETDEQAESSFNDEEMTRDQIELFPNPAENTLFVHLPVGKEHAVSISDQYGQMLYHTATSGSDNELTIPLDGSEFKSGLYLLKIQSQDSSIVKKFFKK